jgi:sugar phosphate isomerase/epimerase
MSMAKMDNKTGEKQMPKTALQLYSIREIADQDFYHALHVAKQAGYSGVEFAGFHGKEAGETKKYINDLGLEAAGSHSGLNSIVDKFTETMEYNEEIGNKYVVVPYLSDQFHNAEGMKIAAEYLNIASADAKKYGISIGYHNHAFEFVQGPDGVKLFDVLAANTSKDVILEIDTFWAVKGGVDPVEYCRKYADRLKLVHFKDITADGNDTEVGKGCIDFKSILKSSEVIEWCIMEQEKFNMPMEQSIAISCDNMKGLLLDRA